MANRPGSQKAERVGEIGQMSTSAETGVTVDVNELETIPTMVPREGDGYRVTRSGPWSARGSDVSASRTTA